MVSDVKVMKQEQVSSQNHERWLFGVRYNVSHSFSLFQHQQHTTRIRFLLYQILSMVTTHSLCKKKQRNCLAVTGEMWWNSSFLLCYWTCSVQIASQVFFLLCLCTHCWHHLSLKAQVSHRSSVQFQVCLHFAKSEVFKFLTCIWLESTVVQLPAEKKSKTTANMSLQVF